MRSADLVAEDCQHGPGRRALAAVVARRGDAERARRLVEEVVAIHRTGATPILLAGAMLDASAVQAELGDTVAAARLLAEALESTRFGEFRHVEATAIEGVAWALASTGDACGAARMLGAVATMRDDRQDEMPPSRRRRREATGAAARAALGEDTFVRSFAAGKKLERTTAAAEALSLVRRLTGKNQSATNTPPRSAPTRGALISSHLE